MVEGTYKAYLASDHWKNLRNRKRSKGARCGICASTEKLDTHHLVYKDLVSVETSDLRVLCRRCHYLAHDLMKAKVIVFKNNSHLHRWCVVKNAVKRALGIENRNMFY